MKNKINNKQQGFSLVEIMIAAVLIGVLGVALSSALPHAAHQRMDARLREAALIEANSLMERVYAQVDENNHPSVGSGFFDNTMTDPGGNPNLQWIFDGKQHQTEVAYRFSNDRILSFSVSVFPTADRLRPVTLSGEKFIKQP